jgi:hypothetical protein
MYGPTKRVACLTESKKLQSSTSNLQRSLKYQTPIDPGKPAEALVVEHHLETP